MTNPHVLYYLAVILIGLPAATQSRMAAVCVAAGAGGCLAWLMGLPMAWAHVTLHTAAFWGALFYAERRMVPLALFIPMGILDTAEICGAITPYDAWWARYWLVLIQLTLFIPDTTTGFLRAFRWVSSRAVYPDSLRFQST